MRGLWHSLDVPRCRGDEAEGGSSNNWGYRGLRIRV